MSFSIPDNAVGKQITFFLDENGNQNVSPPAGATFQIVGDNPVVCDVVVGGNPQNAGLLPHQVGVVHVTCKLVAADGVTIIIQDTETINVTATYSLRAVVT